MRKLLARTAALILAVGWIGVAFALPPDAAAAAARLPPLSLSIFGAAGILLLAVVVQGLRGKNHLEDLRVVDASDRLRQSQEQLVRLIHELRARERRDRS